MGGFCILWGGMGDGEHNIDNVKSYVHENELNWHHAFLEMQVRDAPIRRELVIKAYPTFILLDRENRIVVRGNTSSFEKIKMFFKSRSQLQ